MNNLKFFTVKFGTRIRAAWIYKNFDYPDKKHSDNLYVVADDEGVETVESAMPYAFCKSFHTEISWEQLPDRIKQFCNETYGNSTALSRAVRFDYSGYSIK